MLAGVIETAEVAEVPEIAGPVAVNGLLPVQLGLGEVDLGGKILRQAGAGAGAAVVAVAVVVAAGAQGKVDQLGDIRRSHRDFASSKGV